MDQIEKQIELSSPIARVWQALTNSREFGQWFRVSLDGPFVAGQPSRGHFTYPGYEHLRWEVEVRSIVPEHTFSFTWHPYALDPNVDYSSEAPTVVEFTLQKTAHGSLLKVRESGFDKLPDHRCPEACGSSIV